MYFVVEEIKSCLMLKGPCGLANWISKLLYRFSCLLISGQTSSQEFQAQAGDPSKNKLHSIAPRENVSNQIIPTCLY